MTTKVYENGLRAETCTRLIKEGLASEFDECTVLPIPSSRDGVHVCGTELLLSEVIGGAEDGSLVIGYGIPKVLADEARLRGVTVIDSYGDESFLDANARLTAECALGILLSTVSSALSEIRIGVVGYGRIGVHGQFP